MGRRPPTTLRALPRVFVPQAEMGGPIELPRAEVEKLRKVLRLAEGEQIAVLPDDGTLIVCEFKQRQAWPLRVEVGVPDLRPHVTIAQALPKGDKLDTVLRCCTELGVSSFIHFPSDRSVVKWDKDRQDDRMRRYEAVVREASEQCFGWRLPKITVAKSLAEVLETVPNAICLSELEGETKPLPAITGDTTAVIGPEGGWSPREIELIGDRGVTLGSRVLRVDTAAISVATLLLLGQR